MQDPDSPPRDDTPEAADPARQAYDELCGYTLAHAHEDASFIHQHVVDAFTAQQADEHTKAVALTFALVGLYLHLERGLSGRQVQRMHMRLASRRRPWPTFAQPADRGAMTAADVLAEPAGPERDAAIDRWCTVVWHTYRDSRQRVIDLLRDHGIA